MSATGAQRKRRGCLGFLGLLAAVLIGLWFGGYPYLAHMAPVPAEVLVVEGWVADDLLVQAVAWAETNGVKRIIATGGSVELGSHLTPWKTYADMTRARLEALELDTKFELAAVPAEKVRRDRTRESARALRRAEPGLPAFNLASEGLHARRSWRAFRAEYPDVPVGSVALEPVAYHAGDWWTCSEGVRAMVNEGVAYVYDLLAGAGAD